MEYTTVEVSVVEKAIAHALESQVCELNELQLAYVGGGIAELVGV